MKHKFLLTIAISILCIFTAQATFGQIQISIPWGKKKKEEPKKVESQPSPSPTVNTQAKEETPKPKESSIGTFYFSNKPFPEGSSVEGAKTSFASNEYIYGRLVLKGGTVKDVLKPIQFEGTSKYWIYYDILIWGKNRSYPFNEGWHGRHSDGFQARISESEMNKTYWDFDVLPQSTNFRTLSGPGPGGNYSNGVVKFLTDSVLQTKEGTYRMIALVKTPTKDFRGEELPSEEWIRADSDEFQFTFRGSDYAGIKANHAAIEENITKLEARAELDKPLPNEWTAKSHPIAFGYTLARLQSMFLAHPSNRGVKIIKFYVGHLEAASTWTIQKDNIGLPRLRYHNQQYRVFGKNTQGGCFFRDFWLQQDYQGGGTYSSTYVKLDLDGNLSCEKLGVK